MENLFIKRTKCPVCFSNNISNIFTSSYENKNFKNFLLFEETFKSNFWHDYNNGCFNGQHYTIGECNDCNFIFQTNTLNDSGLKRLYDQWIDPEVTLERHNKLNRLEKSVIFNQRLNVIMRHFSNCSSINVLDWGAGFGDFCVSALNTGINVTALEFSDERKTHLESRGITVAGMEKLQENHYHFINLDQVIEHIEDPVEFLNNIYKYLREDGVLFIGAPNCNKVEKLVKKGILSQELYRYIGPLQHINAFTNKTLKIACKNANFRVLFSINPQPALIYNRQNMFYAVLETVNNFARPFKHYFINTNFYLAKK